MRSRYVILAMTLLALSSSPFARELDCTNTDLDKSHWIPSDKMQQKIAARGHKVESIEVVGNCYKVHYVQKDGRKVEAFFDPIEGHAIRRQRQ
ncbi:MAG TPA: PepSY domain-containing protein [Rhodocyclaceae bacterium]